MGRTLNYTIKKDKGNFNKKELLVMYNVSKFYNSDELLSEINSAYKTKLKELWTCENFWLGIGNFYPNWDNPEIQKSDGWKFVNEKIEELKQSGIDYNEAVLRLQKIGYIIFHDKGKNEFHGFTKTQGNEFNSLLVFKALIEISKKIPTATIELEDEGEFLLCPLKIKKGLALPNVQDLIESIQYYSMKMLLSKRFEGNVLGKLEHTKFQSQCFAGDIGLDNSYGDMTKYIDVKLRNLQKIENVLIKVTKEENELYFYNLSRREHKKWFKAELFVRPVEIEKFLDYKMSAGTLMQGFDGEGFGLSDKDSEAESYKSIAQMFSLLEKMGAKKEDVKVLGQ